MSNSPLVTYTRLSPNHSGRRNHAIDTITIHCMAGNCSVETCGAIFANPARQASSNYGVGTDGRIALYVDEANRSWCTSSGANDHRAVTIEVANDQSGEPWHVSDKALAALIDLCADICKRNGIKKLLWRGDKSLIGQVDKQNMTVHRWFAGKSCPGNYLYGKHGYIADEVNKRLGASTIVAPAPAQPAPGGNAAAGLKVGDTVNFTGTTHYVSSTGPRGTAAKPGKAKITRIAAGAAHPYHLVAESGSTSNVYGWVNVCDISGAASAAVQIKAGSRVKIKPGAKYYSGVNIPAWVLSDTWIVAQVNGDRAVLGKNVSGRNNINSPVKTGDLIPA